MSADVTLFRGGVAINVHPGWTDADMRTFECWSCGWPLWTGELLDCPACRKMLDDAWALRHAPAPLAGVELADVARRLEEVCA